MGFGGAVLVPKTYITSSYVLRACKAVFKAPFIHSLARYITP